MERRKFIRYGALGSSAFLMNLGLIKVGRTNPLLSTTTNKNYDWILLYWMPYDNDLSSFGIPIIEMLAKGVQTDNILVVIESDFSGEKQLSRHVITRGNTVSQRLNTANSSSEEAFAEYLNWARLNFQAKKWAIAFLGHGGHLDEVSPDENPAPGLNLGRQWMNIQKLSNIIARFNKTVDNRVELLFFQNCNKGTLEAHYTARDAAKYTLSSQVRLGVPNYYYEQLLEFLGNQPDINGGELATKIMEFERSDMYYSYTVTNNYEVQNLPAKLNPLIDTILSSEQKAIELQDLNPYYYGGERFVDAAIFFKQLSENSVAAQKKCNEFIDFLIHSMIYRFQGKGNFLRFRRKDHQNFLGLGIFLPKTRQELEKYRYLPFFADLKIIELFDKAVFD